MLDILLPDEKKNTCRSWFFRKISSEKSKYLYTDQDFGWRPKNPHLGYDECALTLEDAAWLKWVPENVFIIENQVCFLTFPKVRHSVAIFGEGFKSRLSKHLHWLNKTKLHCCFDLDTAGFEMLNMIREHYPNASSFLMDVATYNQFVHFTVDNKERKKISHCLHRMNISFINFYYTIVKGWNRKELPNRIFSKI